MLVGAQRRWDLVGPDGLYVGCWRTEQLGNGQRATCAWPHQPDSSSLPLPPWRHKACGTLETTCALLACRRNEYDDYDDDDTLDEKHPSTFESTQSSENGVPPLLPVLCSSLLDSSLFPHVFNWLA